jgi:UDP:flavonoid glycosyltransferase YjiC (YdhE family)
MGHVRYLAEVARRLRDTGHSLTAIMRDVHSADRELRRDGITVLPAPRMPRPNLKGELTVNWAELMIVAGYLQPGALSSLIRSWRALFELLDPDLIVANYAPTALLAARNAPVKVVSLGTGFAMPPHAFPMPTLTPWIEVPEERVFKSEELVVEAINAALAESGEPGIEHLHESVQSDGEVLATFEELDHYPDRAEGRYWGPIMSSDRGDTPEWPAKAESDKKIFCYLKQKHPLFENVLEALDTTSASKLVFAAGLDRQQAERFSGPQFRFAPRPVDLEAAITECDVVICHAGHGTVSAALMSGTPMVLIPENRQLEQIITTRNLCLMGAAQSLGQPEAGQQPAELIQAAIDAVLNNSEHTVAARAFAAKYAEFDPDRQLAKITELCSNLAES